MAYAVYEHNGISRVGEVDGSTVVPLEGLVEIDANSSPELLRDASRLEGERIDLAEVKLRPVSPSAGKIFCVGLNYRSHIDETGRDLPTYPVLFPKYASSLIGAYDDIQLPAEGTQVDYEAEVAVVIGRGGRRISEENALDHVLGYTVANDVTVRDFQYKTHQWMQGKAWDAMTPVGPFLVTPGEVDLSKAGIRTILNGETVQDSDLSYLIFSVPNLIATVSQFTTLSPGDIILTGTPSGVGYRRDPQLFLRDGDEVIVEVDGVGRVANRVVAEAV